MWYAYSGVLRWNWLPSIHCCYEDCTIGQLLVLCHYKYEIPVNFLFTQLSHQFLVQLLTGRFQTAPDFYPQRAHVGPLPLFTRESANCGIKDGEWFRANGRMPWNQGDYTDSGQAKMLIIIEKFPYDDGKYENIPVELDIDHDRLGSGHKKADSYPGFMALWNIFWHRRDTCKLKSNG